MTFKEIASDALKYLDQAWDEWLDNAADSPPSHVYTAIFALVIWHAIKWAL